MGIEKTNEQLGANLDQNSLTDLTMVTAYPRVGLKDGSGNNGECFILDASLYLKIGGVWKHIACTSVGIP